MTPAITELKALHRRLGLLLDDPQPGLTTWMFALSDVLMEMADYAGHGHVSTFPTALKALQDISYAMKDIDTAYIVHAIPEPLHAQIVEGVKD